MIRISLLAAVLLLTGCSKKIDTTDAVRKGVVDYLNSIAPTIHLDINNMQVDVAAVTFEHDHARATVSITPKVAGAKAMELTYNLDREGDKWVVHGNANSAGSGHGQDSQGGTGAVPGQTAPDGTSLPPGHPSTGTGATAPDGTALPPNHPAVGTKP